MISTSKDRLMTPRRSALLCLIAVAMLYAPVVSVAVASCLMPCCTANHCKITSHHHAPAKPASRHDCSEKNAAKDDCAMSGCVPDQQQIVTSHPFVLPTGATLITSTAFPHNLPRVSSAEPQAAPEPLSPPPRPSLA